MMKHKALKAFVREHRKEIDDVILRMCPNAKYFNDEYRRQWVLQEVGLYNWARQEGVQI